MFNTNVLLFSDRYSPPQRKRAGLNAPLYFSFLPFSHTLNSPTCSPCLHRPPSPVGAVLGDLTSSLHVSTSRHPCRACKRAVIPHPGGRLPQDVDALFNHGKERERTVQITWLRLYAATCGLCGIDWRSPLVRTPGNGGKATQNWSVPKIGKPRGLWEWDIKYVKYQARTQD